MPAVARKDGKDTVKTGHTTCDKTTVTDIGSTDVFVNGIGACRKDDKLKDHTKPEGKSCVTHTSYINSGSSTVYVNGHPIARNGDSADEGSITSGSKNVFAGPDISG